MAKLSQQLQQDVPQERVTRSQRVGFQQTALREQLEAKRLKDAQNKLSKANFDNYEQVYNSINPKYRSGYLTPIQMKATPDYQKYQQQKVDAGYVQSLISYASKMDRGKPFALGLNPPKQLVRDVNAYREGLGDGSRQERRTAYLKANFPSLDAGELGQAVNVGTIMHFGQEPQIYGLDRGETASIVTKDTKTGEIKSEQYFTGIGKGGGYEKTTTTTYLTGDALKVEQEKAYQEFLKENPEVKLSSQQSSQRVSSYGVYEPFTKEEIAESKKLSGRYSSKIGDRTIQDWIFDPLKSKVVSGFSYLGGKAKQGLDIVDENVRWDFKLGGSASSPKIQIVSFGKQKQVADVGGLVETGQEKLGDLAFDIKDTGIERQLGSETYEGFKTSKEEKGKQDVTSLFYRSDLGKKAFFDATTQEEVDQSFKQYQETSEFKQYQQDYSTKYTSDLDKLIKDEVPYAEKLKGTYAGLKMAGLNFGSLGLSLVKSPARLGLTAGAIYTGGAVYGSLSTPTLVGLDVAFGTAGAYKVFAPSSSIEERGAGAIMLGVSTTSLGIKGVSYARQPTIKFAEIKAPKMNLKVANAETIGQDIKILTKQGEINKIIYENQKLSQIGVAGRRTLVSTRWRDWLNLDPIYKGVPTAQRGTSYSFGSLRSSTSFTTKSGYQKTFDLLVKRWGYTNYQASQTLRYIQPKVIEQYLSEGVLTIKGSTATGSFEYLTKQPVLNVDQALGIKTRGARTIKDVFDVERTLINLKGGGSVVLQDQTRVSFLLKRGSSPFIYKDMQFSRGLISGKGSELKSGFDVLKSDIKGIKLMKEMQYQDLTGISLSKNILPSDNVLRIDASRTKLIKRFIDLTDDFKPIKPANIKKTPLSKTFGTSDEIKAIKNIIRDVNKVSSNANVKNVIDKIDDFSSGGVSKQQSKFYGKGMYERSSGGLFPQEQFTGSQVQNILKQSIAPPEILIKQQIKGLLDYGTVLKVGVKSSFLTASTSAVAMKNALKLDLGLKSDLKLDSLLKQQLLKQQIRTKQAVSLKTAQVSLFQQINKLAFGQSPSFSSPVFNEPRIAEPNIPFPIIPFYLPNAISEKRGKKKKGKQVQDLLFLPDFTSRVIGLEPETITQKQAQARLKKILTGLEIRRGVVIK